MTLPVDTSLHELIDRHVVVWCVNYIYSGQLESFDASFLRIKDPHVVYETGPLTDKDFKDAQPLPGDYWYIARSAIESIGVKRGG
jgi:hypothetical protein